MKARKSIAELIDDIRSGGAVKIRSAARLMTLAEESSAKTIEILSSLAGDSMPRIIFGITGAPGSGKSLLTGRLIEEFCKRYPERMIGIIAVDPSSPFSGGAILGDRIRMMQHASDEKVFIRSLATHGQVGGVTEGTRGVAAIMGALGCDMVIVETVGVGQMEFAVREVADTVAIVLAPGQGDTIQFLKAGLMEIGDMFIVNKADRPDAAQFHAQLSNALPLLGREDLNAHLVSARDNVGISGFLGTLEEVFVRDHKQWETARQKYLEMLVKRAILSEASKRLEIVLEKQENITQKILKGEISLSSCLENLIKKLK
ncbi:MAG: methylmalonyl Co-A mutase-associated GTPase MeaB [Candidatus Paceibacterota bacterium]|jgi:LAO/AO transport system kinase